jgi:hypothetical protein
MLHLPKGFLGKSGNDHHVAGAWALARGHGMFSLIVATCMAIMPPLKAHRDTISCRKMGALLGREAKQWVEGGWGLGCGWQVNMCEFGYRKQRKANSAKGR